MLEVCTFTMLLFFLELFAQFEYVDLNHHHLTHIKIPFHKTEIILWNRALRDTVKLCWNTCHEQMHTSSWKHRPFALSCKNPISQLKYQACAILVYKSTWNVQFQGETHLFACDDLAKLSQQRPAGCSSSQVIYVVYIYIFANGSSCPSISNTTQVNANEVQLL